MFPLQKKKCFQNEASPKDGDEYQEQIKHFISIPYQKLPPEIFEKYSIKNWVKNIFRIGDYQKIEYSG